MRNGTRIQRAICAVALVASAGCPTVLRADLVWDPGLTGTAAGGGLGTWDTGTSNWFDAGTNADVQWDNSGATGATFGGTGGAVTIAAGGITASNITFNSTGYSIGGASITLVNAPTFTVTNAADSASISSILGGTPTSLTFAGPGTLTLSGANTYTGQTLVTGGVLAATNAGALGASGAGNETLVSSGAALQISGTVTIAEALSLAGTGISNGGALRNTANSNTLSGAITLTGATRINSDSGTLTLSGGINGTDQNLTIGGAGNVTINTTAIATGAGTLTKDGTGLLTLGIANTFTGKTFISGGILSLNADNRLGTVPGTTTADAITLSGGGVLRSTASITVNSARGITLGTGGGGIDVTSSNTLTYGGLIAGSTLLTKSGTGTLVLSGSSTFTSPVTVTGGILSIDSSLRLGTNGVVTLDGGTLRQTNTGNAGSFISATRGIAITANGGTVSYTPGDPSFVTIYTPNAGLTITGVGNTLTKTGTGEFRFNGAGTGITTFSKLVVNQGLFRLGNVSGSNFETGFGAAPASFLADAITLNGGSIGTSYSVSLHNNRGITLGANGGTFNVSSATLTVPGAISGAGSLNKGAGTLILSGVNTYTGSTIIAGTLSITSLAPGGTGSNIGASPAAAANLVFNGGTLSYTGAAVTTDRLFTITPTGGTIDSSGTGPITFSNAGANLSTDKATTNFTVNSGVTAVYLTGSALPTDLVGLAAGMPVSGAGIPAGTTVASVGATLSQFALSANATATTSNTPLTFGPVSRTLTLTGTQTGANTISGVLADSPTASLALTKTGAGTWVLGGASTFTGVTTISAGTLSISADSGLGTPPASAVAAQIALSGGAKLQTTATFTLNANRGLTLGTSGGTIETTGTSVLTYGGIIAGTTALTKEGTGTLVLGGSNSYTGATNVNTGTLAISAADRLADATAVTIVAGATFDLTNNAAGNFNETVASIAGAGGVTLGSATLTLSGSSNTTYSGSIAGTGILTKTGTAVLTLSGANAVSAVNLNAGRINFNNNSAAGTGPINVGNAAGIELSGTAAGIVLPNNIVLATGANPTVYATSGNGLKLTGVISGDGSLTRNDTGAGTLTLAGDSTFTGGVKIVSRGFVLGHPRALGTGVLTVGDTVTAPLTAIAITADTALTGANAVANAVVLNRALTIQGSNSIEWSGALSGVGTLTKSGTATHILSGGASNTYSGLTTINGGILALSKTSATSIAADLQIGDATGTGIVRLLVSDQVANTSKMTIAGGSTFDVNSQNEALGVLALSNVSAGNATIDFGSGTSSIVSFASSSAAAWSATTLLNILNWSGNPDTGLGSEQLLVGTDQTGLTALQLSQIQFINPANLTGTYSALQLPNGEIVPDSSATPEPASVGMLTFAGLLALGRRRRRTVARHL
jgi:autotransporter-associated beta strand protein